MKRQEDYIYIRQSELKRLYQQIVEGQALIHKLQAQNTQLLKTTKSA